jgi:glycosidase
VHWEYFYDKNGAPTVRLYRRLGQLRRNTQGLRGRESFYYAAQSLKGNAILAYHRHAANTTSWAMVLLNFGDLPGDITLPFPKAGKWVEMVDADQRQTPLEIHVAADRAEVQVDQVPGHYGYVFVLE